MHRATIAIAVLTASVPAHAEETVRLRGKLRQRDGGLLAGGTVVAAPASGADIQAAITGDDGAYTFDLPPGDYTISAYFLESTITRRHRLASGTVDAPDLIIDPPNTGCILLLVAVPGAESTARPYFGLDATRFAPPLSRDRTHRAWIAPAPAADARTTVTSLESGVRLHGAPGIPTVFLEDVTTATLRAPIARAAGSGGSTEVSLRHGTNEHHGETRSVVALDHTWERSDSGFAQESFLGGPIVKDRAWYGLGLVVDEERHTHGLARVDYMPSADHQLSVTGLAQDTGAVRDRWAKAGWTAKMNDHRVEFRAAVTGEQLDLVPEAVAHGEAPSPVGASLVNRIGGSLDLTARVRALGYHAFALRAAAGTGAIDDERHRDVSLAAGDSWQLRSNLEVELGVRNDLRTVGGARTSIVSPRAALMWDPTMEGRSEVFVAAQRVPHLDDGFIGGWRADPGAYHDELSAGASYQPPKLDAFMAGAAIRTTGDRTGIDGWLRLDRAGSMLHAAGSTLNRAAVLYAQHRIGRRCRTCRSDLTGLTAMAAVRTQQVARSPGEAGLRVDEGSLGLAWRGRGKGLQPATSIELYNGTLGTGARLVLGGAW